MRLCIPTKDDSGLDAVPSDYFGSAPFFTLVDTDTEKVEVVRNPHRLHEQGKCDPLRCLDTERIDLVVCQGMGRRAMSLLAEAGIPFFMTWQSDVAAMLAAYREGRLGETSPEEGPAGGDTVHTNCLG